jgi:AcrR family transcriptional regulator
MPGPASARGAATREALLDATEAVIIRDGIPAVSTRRVADEAGQNPALVHYHFRSVEQLLLSTVQRILSRVAERNDAIWLGDEPPPEKISRAVAAYFDEDDRNRGWHKLWVELVAIRANRPEQYPELVNYIANELDRGARMLDRVLEAVPTTAEDLRLLMGIFSYGLMVQGVLGLSEAQIARALELFAEILESQVVAEHGACTT